MKNDKQKKLLLECLHKTPIIEYACKQSNISRATFYRWKKQSNNFAKEANEAITEGLMLINDLAEGQLISAIKDRNMSAIIYWLKNRHSAYADKLQVNASINNSKEQELTPEQRKTIAKALKLATLDKRYENKQNKKVIEGNNKGQNY